MKLIFFGDSLTSCDAIPSSRKWVDLLESRISGHFRNETDFTFLNRGVCGENTRQALERFQSQVQHVGADILVIQLGVNDSDYLMSNRGLPTVSKGAFRENLLEMVSRARVFNVPIVILQTNHLFNIDRKEGNGLDRNENLRPYNELIRQVVREMNCYLSDIEDDLAHEAPAEYTLPLPDGIHLNDKGCELYAQHIFPRMSEWVGRLIFKKQKEKR